MIRRRSLLQIGALGPLAQALALPQLLAGERAGRARSCILFFLEGGPSHIDLWDMKPQAAAEIRGEFQAISSSVPGTAVCEHLPLLARQMHHLAQVRSVHHKINDHNAGAYYALTGRSPLRPGGLIVKDEPDNFPPFGSVMAELAETKTLPPFVHVPEIMFNNGNEIPGQRAGWLGTRRNPLLAGDPSVPKYRLPGLGLLPDVSIDRLVQRRELLGQLNRSDRAGGEASSMDQYREQAYALLQSGDTQRAFDLSQESAQTRARYGLPDRTDRSVEARKFGGLPHLGQSLLLARRLVEAGVRLVTVCTGRRYDQSWDTHREHFPLLKRSLLPYADRAFSALLEDLDQRGLLEETLVVAMGEFGRTPRLGQITSGAGADKAGRDHWPHCYTVMLAGAGVPGGAVYGASDEIGAYPAKDPVTPEDIAATIYALLGLDPERRIVDNLGRPHSIALGTPIDALLNGATTRLRQASK